MSSLRILSVSVVLMMALNSAALADPVQNYVATYSDSLGLVDSSSISLPDLNQGGSVILGSLPIVVNPTGGTPQASTLISGTFQLYIYPQPQGGAQGGVPFDDIVVNGTIQGTITAVAGNPNTFSGNLTSSVGSVGFPQGNLYDASDLQALANNMLRIHVIDQVVTGPDGKSLLQESLTIDSPEIIIPGTPSNGAPTVPEPTALATFVVAIAGLAIKRRWLRRPMTKYPRSSQ
jgi:hypothetical protein